MNRQGAKIAKTSRFNAEAQRHRNHRTIAGLKRKDAKGAKTIHRKGHRNLKVGPALVSVGGYPSHDTDENDSERGLKPTLPIAQPAGPA